MSETMLSDVLVAVVVFCFFYSPLSSTSSYLRQPQNLSERVEPENKERSPVFIFICALSFFRFPCLMYFLVL